jgi:uncharacterized protein
MPRVCHFEIPADDTKRAMKFFESVFGWKFENWSGGDMEYWMTVTGPDSEPGINGGLHPRGESKGTVNTIDVPNVDEYIGKIKKAGGKVLSEKMPIPTVGYFANCEDTEGNRFGIIQFDKSAK